MGYKPSLNRTLDHPFFRETVTLYRGGSTDSDSDGYPDLSFDTPIEADVIVTSPQRSPFEVIATGSEVDYEHAMRAPSSLRVTRGDRIVYDDGYGPKPYMVQERRSDRFAGDEYSWFLLIDDPRGDASDGGGDSGSGDETDSGTGDSGGSDGGYGTYS